MALDVGQAAVIVRSYSLVAVKPGTEVVAMTVSVKAPEDTVKAGTEVAVSVVSKATEELSAEDCAAAGE